MSCSRDSWLPALFWCETLWMGVMCCLCLAGVLVVLSGVQTDTHGCQPFILGMGSPWVGRGWGGCLCEEGKGVAPFGDLKAKRLGGGGIFSCLLPHRHLPLGGKWVS